MIDSYTPIESEHPTSSPIFFCRVFYILFRELCSFFESGLDFLCCLVFAYFCFLYIFCLILKGFFFLHFYYWN